MSESLRAPGARGEDETETGSLPEDGADEPQQVNPPARARRETLLAAVVLLALAAAWAALLISLGRPRAEIDLAGLVTAGLATLAVYILTLAFYHYRASAGIPAALFLAGLLYLLIDLANALLALWHLPAWTEQAHTAGLLTFLATTVLLGGLLQWMLKSRDALNRQIRMNRRLGALNAMMRALSVTPELTAITQAVVRQAMRALRAEAGTVLLVDPATEELEFVATAGPQSESLVGLRLPPGTGIAGWSARQGRAARVANAQVDSRFYAGVDRLTGQTTRSVLVVPIRTRDRTLGVIELINRRPSDQPRRARPEFSDDDLAFMELLARSAAAALENARLVAELHAADRARRELIANLAHELRAPLTFLMAHAELLAAGALGPLTEAQQNSADVIVQKADMLAALAANVVSLERVASAPLAVAPVDLARLAADAVAGAAPAAARSGITLEIDAGPGLSPALGDEQRLMEVLDNLLSNALKFTPAGGRITVRVADAGPSMRVSVQDTGSGIPEEQRAHVFERFYQAAAPGRRTSGAGLGLAICSAIVRAHGGEIGVESEVGHGSTFHFTVPKAKG